MLKTLTTLFKQDKERYTEPRRVQDAIPIKRIWNDGIFLAGNRYCRTWRFSDINYQVASADDKKVMFLDYSEVLNSLEAGSVAKIPNLMGSGRTLAVHMYVLSSEGLYMDQAYATAVVLLVFVLVLNGISNLLAKQLTKGRNA